MSILMARKGMAQLNDNGLIPASLLPSYVDEIVEYDNKNSFPVTGEVGKIYVDKFTRYSYRWSGSQYIAIINNVEIASTDTAGIVKVGPHLTIDSNGFLTINEQYINQIIDNHINALIGGEY